MKKALSLILALTLAMALVVPALAAGFGELTFDYQSLYSPKARVTFSAAKMEITSVDIDESNTGNSILITVQPGSTFSTTDCSISGVDLPAPQFSGAGFAMGDDGKYHQVATVSIGAFEGELDSLFGDAKGAYYFGEESSSAQYFKNGANDHDICFIWVPECAVYTSDGNEYSLVLTLDGKMTASAPTPETSTAPAGGTAYASTQTVELDGKKVEFQMYALKEANGGLTNYIKVRDLAFALNGTKAQFSVDWDGQVNLVTGAAYTANGSENSTPFSGDRAYTVPTSPTNVNGEASDLAAIVLTDDNGGGYNYYKLRDLGSKLGFNVDWTAERGVFIESDKPYGG